MVVNFDQQRVTPLILLKMCKKMGFLFVKRIFGVFVQMSISNPKTDFDTFFTEFWRKSVIFEITIDEAYFGTFDQI